MKSKIVFDIFGVLITGGFDSSQHLLESLLQTKSENIKPVFEKWEVPFDLGQIDEEQFWAHVQEELGINVDWRGLNEAVINSYRPLEQNLQILEVCTAYTDTYLLSNTRREWFERLDSKYRLSSRVKKTFLSYEMRLIKPNKKCFAHVIEALDCDASDIVFIDDRSENIESAKELGLQTVLYRTTEHLAGCLTEKLPGIDLRIDG